MTSNKEDMLYVDYNDYNYVTREFKEAIEYNYDEDSLEKVISYMRSLKHNMKKEDDIIKKFFRLLRNDDIYIKGTTPKYCKYINLWLNKEYLKEHNQNKVKNFDVFKKFVNQLNYVKFGNQDNSCEKYINPLETKTIIKIEFLYDLYDKYNKIKSLSPEVRVEGCDELDFLSYNYRQSIYNYYFEDQDLYNKLEYIIGEIDKKTGIKNSPCTHKIDFTKPPNLVKLLEDKVREEAEEQAAKLAKEAAARQIQEAAARRVQEAAARRVQEAADRRVHEAEARRVQEPAAQKLQEEQYHQQHSLLQPKVSLLRSPDKELQGMHHENGELHPTSYRAESQGSVTSRLQSPAQRLVSSEMSESSTGSLFLKKYTQQGPMTYTIEGTEQPSELVHDQEDKGTTKAGTFFSSSGFPGYITEVLGSVEPAPVLCVSGGMGALFLLFKVLKTKFKKN
ncbi:hypothetical protein PVIIG_05787 [Plasmodium vivax India VII]|uniref:VIR protein n=1 Tax=Plasmodium vivax India VII TaxID=1077284 RepID=A0A0J9S1M7_PLAVI|nr:hypothetical protein PVIIG_05787 [Plasmodium vivax India VII]